MAAPRDILLVHDRAYWVLGQHAVFLEAWLQRQGLVARSAVWREVLRDPPAAHTLIVPLCVGIARHLLEAGIFVDRAVVVSESYWGEAGGWDPRFADEVLSRLGRLAVINAPYHARLEARIGDRVQVLRVHQFVDTDRYAPGATPLPCTLGERLRERGPGGLVVGWCGDTKKAAKRFAWVQALRDDPELGALRFRLATKRHQAGRFVPAEQMPRWYAGLDLLICTSQNEGNPMPPLEALACGVPVVSCPVGVMPEAIHDGENGFLVDSLAALREKVLMLDRDRALLQRLAEGARASLLSSPFAPGRALPGWIEALDLSAAPADPATSPAPDNVA